MIAQPLFATPNLTDPLGRPSSVPGPESVNLALCKTPPGFFPNTGWESRVSAQKSALVFCAEIEFSKQLTGIVWVAFQGTPRLRSQRLSYVAAEEAGRALPTEREGSEPNDRVSSGHAEILAPAEDRPRPEGERRHRWSPRMAHGPSRGGPSSADPRATAAARFSPASPRSGQFDRHLECDIPDHLRSRSRPIDRAASRFFPIQGTAKR